VPAIAFQVAAREGVGAIGFSPLAQDLLTGRYAHLGRYFGGGIEVRACDHYEQGAE
jgi:aryl-alcohol dehydrogenase-like predicted oxidoreductase